MSEELKPCPFCGSSANVGISYNENGKDDVFCVVLCTNILGCGATVESDVCVDKNEAKADAVRRWNRRI